MTDRNYGILREAEKFEAFVDRLIKQNKPVGFDIEASYSDPKYIEKGALLQFHPSWFLVSFSFTNSTEWARTVPIAYADGQNVDDVIRVARALWRLLNHKNPFSGKSLIVAHNLSYEIKGCRRWFKEVLWEDPEVGAEVRAQDGIFEGLADSMLEVWLSAEYEPQRSGITTKDLKGIVEMAFGHTMIKFDDLFKEEGKKSSKDKRFHLLDSTKIQVRDYCCEDAVWCLALHEKHGPDFEDSFIFKIEMGLIPVCIEMEIEGMYLDWEQISRKADETLEFRNLANEEIQRGLEERLGRMLNLNLGSPQQLAQVLYDPEDGLGLPIKKRTDTNQPSTDEEALRGLAKADPVIKRILEWKEIAKLWSSYLHKYEVQLNYAGNGRAYPNHNQAGALTGRFSVDGVSYQQWPKPYHYELASGRTYDLNFRDLLIAPPGFRIMGWDYSQVELRVLAALSHETAMLAAFASGEDIHRATASSMMGVPLADVTKKMRGQGKTLNFAVVYGSGPENIADMLTTPDAPVTKDDAKELLRKYFAAFPNLKAWMDARVAEGKEQHFVHTPFGRKFTVWEYKDHRDWVRNKGDRMCVNAPVQGGAADYMKIAMVRVNKAIKKAGLADKIRMIMTIHDSLVFYVADDVDSQTVIDLVNPAVSFEVPILPVEIRTDWFEGHRWGTAPDIELDENKQIVGYSHTVELPDKSELHWEGKTLEAVLDQYESWRKEYDEKKNLEQQALISAVTPTVVAEQQFSPEVHEQFAEAGLELLEGEAVQTYINSLGAELAPVGDIDDLVTEADQKMSDSLEEDPPWLHGDIPMAFEPQQVVVTLEDMPDEQQWSAFESWLADHAGEDLVTVVTPEGDVELETKHSISPGDQPVLSIMFGGASVKTGPVPSRVKVVAISEGLEL